ncbi:MAG: GHKL domain-containing protein [Lachnospiraceae bacterium]|nr:GHKL domain-containing protein [Lachnospiraceae bacterium]
MKPFLSQLLWLCISLCSAWLIMHSMEYLISLKQNNRRLKRCAMLIGCWILSNTVIFIGDPFNILAVTLLFMAMVLISCEGSFWKKLTLGAMYASTILSFNVLRDNYLKPLFERLEIFLFPERRLLYDEYVIEQLSLDFIQIVSIFTSFFFSLLLYICTKKSAPDKDYTLSDHLWKLMLLLTAAPFSIVLSLGALFDIGDSLYLLPPHYLLTPVKYLPILLIAIFTFVILLRCIIILARQQKLEQQVMFTEINRKYYESMELHHFEIRRLKHDLANHLQILSNLPEEKRNAYLSELTENTAITQSMSYCEDTTINAVLTVKKNLMELYGISMELTIDICTELPFDKTDICALYANALDNAIEACMKLPETERRITLKSKAQKGLFCLEVSNPITSATESISENDMIPPTSKADKSNHGFGLKSIKEIVGRYHGSLELETSNGTFNLFLYIPLL